MIFTRLRILGFKSFVEPMEFLIEPGLTGVVGPNGCGKSNLVEALRWVMGEASYKNMRASGMDDVIFSGSGNRPPRNTAEVGLFIDNNDRTAPASFNDSDSIEVSRRIEREAGSVYKINGRDVRARDVQLLFADASTGAHSPAMVGQGRIGELIAAKPKDRRAILEEAAGISGLHNRRHEAELRLSAAEQNLARLDDVVAEIDSQLETLKRQARQAVRYRNLSGEVRRAEATVLHLRWVAATEAEGDAAKALEAAVETAQEKAGAQAAAGRVQAEAAGRLPELRDAAARAGAALQRLITARDVLNAEEARITERLAELDERLRQLADDIAREEQMVVENKAMLGRLDEEEARLVAADATMAGRQATAQSRRDAAESALAESERDHSELTARVAELTARRQQAERTAAQAAAQVARQREELAKVAAALADLSGTAAATAEVAARTEMRGAAEARVQQSEAATVTAEQRSRIARERVAGAREPLAEAESTLARLETEAATLEALLEPARSEDQRPVIDSVRVDPGFEQALGAALGEDLDATDDIAASAHWRRVDTRPEDPTLPAGIQPLSDHVEAPALLARRLAQIGLVDRTAGAALQPVLRPGQRLVSREGDLWRWDGFVAAADSATPAAKRLAARNRLAEIESEADAARQTITERRDALEAAMAESRRAEEAERAAREAWRESQRSLDSAREALSEAERAAGRLATRRSALEEAEARLSASIGDAEESQAAAQAILTETPAAERFAEEIAALRASVDEHRTASTEARASVESLEREAEMRRDRLAAIAEERRSWQGRAANAESQIATLAARREEAEADRQRLAEEPERIEVRRRALLGEVETAETEQTAAVDRLAAGETELAEADKAARIAQDELAEAREHRGRAEERDVAAKERITEVAERIGEALGCQPQEAINEAGLKPEAPLPALADVERRLERYRNERERLGAVNLRAEAEAAEVGERREVLVGERDDLVAAIQRLRQGIASLNREGRERLLGAFDIVNAHFRELFTHLFGGGTAELQLTESDDPLEAGLDIMARPPGKKPQSMTLLSGGEQALTALALIFAVFRTNPAPICVLDEVDAPLDDANVERFCNLLDEMTRQTNTRFVVITHNPITMARMNRLFGVTMAERGVSQLVSVDLETAERFREAS